MGMRHAAVVAGLALGLMSGSAKAAAVNFDINYTQGSVTAGNFGQVTGTLTADVQSNGLVDAIGAYNLQVSAQQGTTTSSIDISASSAQGFYNGNSLYDKAGFLIFEFNNTNTTIHLNNTATTGAWYLSSGVTGYAPNISIDTPAAESGVNFLVGTATTLGTVSPVPLPASAPLFGAALIALGAAGYGLKRKSKAAAQA